MERWKKQLGGAALAAALVVSFALYALGDEIPTLSFEGARIETAEDGSLQLFFDVCISNVRRTDGASFTLTYNSDYLTPSNYTDNAALASGDLSSLAFRYNEDLFRVDKDEDGIFESAPYLFKADDSTVTSVSDNTGTIRMQLFTDVAIYLAETVHGNSSYPTQGVELVYLGENESSRYCVFNASGKLKLGTLSFRVSESADLSAVSTLITMSEVFEGQSGTTPYWLTKEPADRLLYFTSQANNMGEGEWGIGVCIPMDSEESDTDYLHVTYDDYNYSAMVMNYTAQAYFAYHFPKTLIGVEAAEQALTLNAYQVYVDGHVSDLNAALQTYSPALTLTYSDGSKATAIMPWARVGDAVDGLPWTTDVASYQKVTLYDPVVSGSVTTEHSNTETTAITVDTGDYTVTNVDVVTETTDHGDGTATTTTTTTTSVTTGSDFPYDPTASAYESTGLTYLMEKYYCYTENGQTKTFPLPVQVRLTVTPVTLVSVTAENLSKTYAIADTLVDGPAAVKDLSSLKLPTQVRLATDVPVNATLTMDIPGWSHVQANGKWPSVRVTTTDEGTGDEIVVSGTGTDIGDLWRDDATSNATDATNGKYLHWPVLNDAGKWTETEENGSEIAQNRRGIYTFKMAASYGGEVNATGFTRTEIQGVYPWLTVPAEAYPLSDAVRTIIWNDEAGIAEKVIDSSRYAAKYVSTTVEPAPTNGSDPTLLQNGQPTLTLQVSKKAANGNPDSLFANSVFRIKLPDGTEIGTGLTSEDWFAGNDGSYQKSMVTLGDYNDKLGYELIINPGDPTVGGYSPEREKLRRYINLGGWFSVSVKETEVQTGAGEHGEDVTIEYAWSDYIPVYVPPRENDYTENKVYNFIGENAGLYFWPGGVSTSVILPPGVYEPVEIATVVGGEAIQPVYTINEESEEVRVTERYGVATTYDGATGAQPGELHQFVINGDAWQTASKTVNDATLTPYTEYGADFFKDGYTYNAFGDVNNLMDTSSGGREYAAGLSHTATVRVQEAPASATGLEKIVLRYVSTNGGERSVNIAGENVATVIYEARTEGYTYRQDYTLEIANVGDVDIYGLSIDTLTDQLPDYVEGGHFVVLKPPASFLPAGESTTFVLSYVYDLPAKGGATAVDYKDRLYITSSSKNNVTAENVAQGAAIPAVEGTDYLLDFEAHFQVSASELHRVTVVTNPANGSMGTAGVIVGLGLDGLDAAMDTTAGSSTFAQGNMVYVMVSLVDEYDIGSFTVIDSSGAAITAVDDLKVFNDAELAGYGLPDNVKVYGFPMPGYDTTVTVQFTESTYSKLRLSNLRAFANPTYDDFAANRTEYTVWQKSYTAAEKAAAAAYTSPETQGYYLMTRGKAAQATFDGSTDQYLVVIPYEADWAQLELTLRQAVLTEFAATASTEALTNVTVQMLLYTYGNSNYDLADPNSITSGLGQEIYMATNGATDPATTHASNVFAAPEAGQSEFVRIRLSHGSPATTRYYFVEIHRKPAEVDADKGYGNSPYGMIMNDSSITFDDDATQNTYDKKEKSAAKAAFVANNYCFGGMKTEYVPAAITANGNNLTGITYWTEAWVAPDAVYEPETRKGLDLYSAANNLDLDKYALFILLGNQFTDPGIVRATDSSGRAVDLSTITFSITAYTLDTTVGLTQLERFALPDVVVAPVDPGEGASQTEQDAYAADLANYEAYQAAIAARTVTLDQTVTGSGEETTVEKWYNSTTIAASWGTSDEFKLRPGRYLLTYHIPDYDYTEEDPSYLTVTRDLVILAPVGDIDANLAVEPADKDILQARTAADAGYADLGYMAANYPDGAIFKMRVCDTNNDRNINNIDANNIAAHKGVTRYYLPTDYK